MSIYYWPKSTPGWRTAVGRLEWGGRVFGLKFVCLCSCVRRPQSGFGQTPVPCPEPTHRQPSFALNSVPSAWLGDNTAGFGSRRPLRGAHLLTLGASQPPTLVSFGAPWLAPHLVLRGAGVIPQELVAHLITVGNTWPFLQGEEEEGQKEEEEKGRNKGRAKRENKWGNMA